MSFNRTMYDVGTTRGRHDLAVSHTRDVHRGRRMRGRHCYALILTHNPNGRRILLCCRPAPWRASATSRQQTSTERLT